MARRLLAAALTSALAACSPAADITRCDPSAFHGVRVAHARRAEVTLCGPVLQAGYLRRSRSGIHRVFVVAAGGSEPVRIDANVGIMGDFPIRRGEQAVVRGEYYDDGGGRDGVHWTHRTDRGSHPPGFVELDGVVYR